MGIIKTYLLNCSFHGIPYTADDRYHWTERIFWIIMVILSWLASVYIMNSSYEQFHTSAISFTVDTSYLSWESEFPAIVFCEKGNSRINYYANLWFNISLDYTINEILKDLVFFKGGSITGTIYKCLYNSEITQCPFKKSDFIKYTQQVRSKCNDLFLYCAWNEKKFSCCKQIMPMDTVFGKCYAINSLASRKPPITPLRLNVTHKAGLDVGKLTIELQNPDLKVFVLSRSAVPLYTDDSNMVMDGILTSPHQMEQNDIYLAIEEIVNEKSVRSTDIKRRECRFIDENNLQKSKTYSISSCFVECLFKIQFKKCGCNHHLMPMVEKDMVCDMDGLICLAMAFDDIMEMAAQECVCDSSCINTEITIVGSIATQDYTDFKNQKSVTELNFILRAPTVRCFRTVVYGYLDVIVSLGGTAGLCVGASILTIIEFFYYLIVRPMNDCALKRSYKTNKKFRVRKQKIKHKVYPFVH